MVLIESKESFINRREVALNLIADQLIEFYYPLLDLLCQFLLLCCSAGCFGAPIGLRVLTSQGHLREEELSKLRITQLSQAPLKDVLKLEKRRDFLRAQL